MKRIEDLTSRSFGMWVVLKYGFRFGKNNNRHKWLCKCSCGTERLVDGWSLKSGASKSCGCYGMEQRRKATMKHGLTGSKIYVSWRNMKARCLQPSYQYYNLYGGRGISFDPRWDLFLDFYEDMVDSYEEGLELDRIDPDGNYYKDNCRWATQAEQCYNQRLRKDNKTGRAGVNWHITSSKWIASIGVNNKSIHIGSFDKFKDAVKAREEAELKYYGFIKQ